MNFEKKALPFEVDELEKSSCHEGRKYKPSNPKKIKMRAFGAVGERERV